jgi:hypothetical protein
MGIALSFESFVSTPIGKGNFPPEQDLLSDRKAMVHVIGNVK